MYSTRRVLLALVLALTMALTFSTASLGASDFITIGTSAVGGSYYLYGGGVASYVQTHVPGLNITAQTTRGSYENMRLIGNRINMTFVNALAAWERANGVDTFAGEVPAKNLRGVLVADIATSHWVTLADSKIAKLEDLVGKKVSVGEPGGGSERSALNVFEAYGITDTVKQVRLGFSASVTALRDGQIDAFVGGSAIPMPAVVDISTTRRVRLLSLSEDAVNTIVSHSPSSTRLIITPGTYKGVDYPVVAIGTPSLLLADVSVSEDVVYSIVKALYSGEGKAYMRNVYSAWDPQPMPEFFKQIGVQMHPGAERYYREVGLMK